MKTLAQLLLLLAICVSTLHAQHISIKTVPVATGDQFLFFPSKNLGMGGVTLALDDPLLDPFTNPARGAFVDGSMFVSTPLFYNISLDEGFGNNSDQGSGRTIPLGLVSNEGGRFGSMLLAWQQISVERPNTGFFNNFVDDTPSFSATRAPALRDNLFGYMSGGLQSEDQRISFGLAIAGGRLNGMEGVRLLYWQGSDVDQEGHMFQIKTGITARLTETRTLDVVLLHHRFSMEHNFLGESRVEEDETNGIGLQVDYTEQLEDGWRVGGQVIGNWQFHPKIPNYDLMQIPRDPGNTSAYNLGIGFARDANNLTFGVDIIFEPIRSHTWADALTDIPLFRFNEEGEQVQTGVIPAGEKTVDNFFRFNNRILRAGISQSGDRVDLQFGAAVHTIRYHLDQINFEQQFERSLNEKWSEWTLSAGIGLKFASFRFNYLGRLTLGTGQPGTFQPWGGWGGGCPNCAVADTGFSGSFIVAPNGVLTLNEARVFSHQFFDSSTDSGRS